MKEDEAGHGPEGYCNYLERKNLLHVKCKNNECRLRKSLCDHNQLDSKPCNHNGTTSQHFNVGDEKSNDIIRKNNAANKGVNAVALKRADDVERQTLETLFSKSDYLQVVSNQGITDHALHKRFKIRTVGQENGFEAKNEEHIDSIKENNAIRGEYHEGEVTDQNLDEKTNPYKERTVGEMMTMITKAFINQGKKDHRSVYSNTSVTIETDGETCHKRKKNTFKWNKDLYQDSQRMLPNIKMRKCDPNAFQESIMFGEAEIHGLSIKYALKIILSKGLRILLDTGQPLF